jgi:trans-aconitate methyltransferase
MLDLAWTRAPNIKFQQFDIRHFATSDNFDAVISACNRPAHITSGADFLTILANVGKCLNPQGFFLFYLYSETAYASRWNGSFSKMALRTI